MAAHWRNIATPALIGLLATVLAETALGQTYSFSAPLTGWAEVALSFGPGSIGSSVTTFGTLNGTLFYDPIAQTLRQTGSISLSPVLESFPISGGFSSPLGLSGSADLSIGDGTGVLLFDSGTQPISPGTDQCLWTLSLPVSGSCTVVNNGLTNSGPVSYSVDLKLLTTIVSASPTSLVVNGINYGGADTASEVANIGGMALYNGSDDGMRMAV